MDGKESIGKMAELTVFTKNCQRLLCKELIRFYMCGRADLFCLGWVYFGHSVSLKV